MFNKETVLAIIPARMGSRRLPKKNLLPLHGRPLIAWSIEAAIRSKFVDKIVVSTENSGIKKVALRYGAEVVDRPSELAHDESTTVSVVEHAIQSLSAIEIMVDWILLLQPTSPLRGEKHIDEAFELIHTKKAMGAVSVCRTGHPIEWIAKLPEDGFMDKFFEDTRLDLSSQKVQPSYTINGAIYIVRADAFLEKKSFFLESGVAAYVMDRKLSIDIDEAFDLEQSEFIIQQMRGTLVPKLPVDKASETSC